MNVNDTNLSLNRKNGTVFIMKHKGTPAMREYWREAKAKEREREKKAKKQ